MRAQKNRRLQIDDQIALIPPLEGEIIEKMPSDIEVGKILSPADEKQKRIKQYVTLRDIAFNRVIEDPYMHGLAFKAYVDSIACLNKSIDDIGTVSEDNPIFQIQREIEGVIPFRRISDNSISQIDSKAV